MRRHQIRTASPTLRELFDILDRREMSQAELADRIGTYQVRVSAWRTGKNAPSILTVEELAEVLGYRVALVPIESADEGLSIP